VIDAADAKRRQLAPAIPDRVYRDEAIVPCGFRLSARIHVRILTILLGLQLPPVTHLSRLTRPHKSN